MMDQTSSPKPKTLLEFVEAQMAADLALMRGKNRNYGGGGGDKGEGDGLANFRRIETETDGMVTSEDGLRVRIADKWSRLNTLLNQELRTRRLVLDANGRITAPPPSNDMGEAVEDTIRDLRNYLFILEYARLAGRGKVREKVPEKVEAVMPSAPGEPVEPVKFKKSPAKHPTWGGHVPNAHDNHRWLQHGLYGNTRTRGTRCACATDMTEPALICPVCKAAYRLDLYGPPAFVGPFECYDCQTKLWAVCEFAVAADGVVQGEEEGEG